MSMPLSPTRLFVCTACGAVLPVGPELLGKKCRCGRCGKVSLISEDHNAEDAPRRRAERSPASNQSIHFNCRVCDTHLSARARHVGRKAKCPDCGALTKVPPPPKNRPKKTPKAMHGQQYGVWGVDDAPDPAELRAKQPKFFPVYCRNCDTLMHARMEQVGKQLACPDCGAKTVFEEPPEPKSEETVLVPDGQEYQLDPTYIPPTRPEREFQPPVSDEESAKFEAIRTERAERPKLPLLPTLQGVAPLLLRSPVPGWWFGLSLAGCLELGLLAIGLGGHVLLLVLIVPPLLFIGIGAFSAAGALWLSVLTESSEGNDRVHHPPGPVFLDWIGNMFYLITSGMLAFAPWWIIGQIVGNELSIGHRGLIQACGWLFTFPLLLLSCLENGSPMDLYSARIFSSVAKLPGHWLLLVVQSIVLAGGCLLAVAGLLTYDPRLAFAAVPLCVAASMLYFRILGRFGWWLAESLATTEEVVDEE